MGDGPRRTLQEGDSPDTMICMVCATERPASYFVGPRSVRCAVCWQSVFPSRTVDEIIGIQRGRLAHRLARQKIVRAGRLKDAKHLARERAGQFAVQTRRRNARLANKRKP